MAWVGVFLCLLRKRWLLYIKADSQWSSEQAIQRQWWFGSNQRGTAVWDGRDACVSKWRPVGFHHCPHSKPVSPPELHSDRSPCVLGGFVRQPVSLPMQHPLVLPCIARVRAVKRWSDSYLRDDGRLRQGGARTAWSGNRLGAVAGAALGLTLPAGTSSSLGLYICLCRIPVAWVEAGNRRDSCMIPQGVSPQVGASQAADEAGGMMHCDTRPSSRSFLDSLNSLHCSSNVRRALDYPQPH